MDVTGNTLQARLAASSAQANAAESLRTSARTDAPAEAGRKFEALFATLLVKEMRQSLSEGFFGSGPQSDVYAGWLDQFVGEAIARDGGLHLADGVRQSLERKQAAERAALDAELAGAPMAAGAARREHGNEPARILREPSAASALGPLSKPAAEPRAAQEHQP